MILRGNYLLIYRILNPSLLQLNKFVVIMISIITYDIVVILLSAAVAVAYDIIIKIDIIVIDKIVKV